MGTRRGRPIISSPPVVKIASESSPSFASSSALNLRGGALSVDNEGNLYTPRSSSSSSSPAPKAETQRRKRTVKSAAAATTVRGGTVKNDRFGRLSVDAEGNL